MADNGSLCVCFGRRTLGGGGVGVGGRVGGGSHLLSASVGECCEWRVEGASGG